MLYNQIGIPSNRIIRRDFLFYTTGKIIFKMLISYRVQPTRGQLFYNLVL